MKLGISTFAIGIWLSKLFCNQYAIIVETLFLYLKRQNGFEDACHLVVSQVKRLWIDLKICFLRELHL